MMRVVSLLLVASLLAVVSAGQEKKGPPTPEEYEAILRAQMERIKKQQESAPKTLAEAHERLEQTLSAETLAEIDAMPSENDMIKYHFSLGLNMRNGWGLWADLPLAQHMRDLGFLSGDDMSGVILDTFWCKRHGQDFRLEERAARIKRDRDDRENPDQGSRAEIRKMMLGLRLVQRDVPVVPIPVRRHGANVRFLRRCRGGVFLAAYGQGIIPSSCYRMTGGLDVNPVTKFLRVLPEYDDAVARGYCADPTTGNLRKMKPGEDFYTVGCYFDPADRAVHPIRVPEINDVYATLAADDRAWFAGLMNGKAVLVGVGDHDRITIPLPQQDEIPDLGLDGQSLLAVYSKTIYRLADHQWTLVHAGDILLPRSGLPPQRHEDMVFLRDEGVNEARKRLWWLVVGEKARLRLLVCDMGLFESDAPGSPGWQDVRSTAPSWWGETSSYCVTSKGDLWACIGDGSYLLRRAQNGTYSYAIADGSVHFAKTPTASEQAEEDLSVSGVAAQPDGTLLLVGYTGLYQLRGNELIRELAFSPQDSDGKAVGRWYWNPNNVLALNDGSYLLGTGSWRGVYLLRQDDDGRWTCQVANEGDPVVW